jgi:LPS export ABC transporter permease LptG/LPS export ABC transporter permease LptF
MCHVARSWRILGPRDMRTLDRYIIREIIPPLVLVLLIFTFLLVLPPMMQNLEGLLAKGVSTATAARIIWTLVPQALGLTIPMALLVGILIGLGRLSSDREAVALLACGVSPYRLLRPILSLAAAATVATLYVMIVAIPDANQTFREITFDIITKRVETDIHPRVFFQDFPGWVLYPRDEPEPGTAGWKDLLVADTSRPPQTKIYLAKRGRLVLDRAARKVDLILEDGVEYAISKPEQVQIVRFPNDLTHVLNPDAVFPRMTLQRGLNEKTIPELRADMRTKHAARKSLHPEILAIQQKFSIPAACIVFSIIGLALGMTVAREGKLAGFVVGVAVIFAYYIVMYLAESLTKGSYAEVNRADVNYVPAYLARWAPDILLFIAGVAALVWRARFTEARLPFRLPLPNIPGRSKARDRGDSGRRGPRLPASGRSRGTVLVIRFPRLRPPSPGLIDRYVSRLYLRVVGLSFLGLLGLFYISTFIDRSERIFKGQATTSMVGTLLVYSTPQFVYYVIPIAALLSVLVTFGLLSRNAELTVLKACGVSLYRVALSVIVLSLAFSAVLFTLEQHVLAHANRRAEALDSTIRGRPPKIYDAMNRRWMVGKDGEIYHYAYFDPGRDEMSGLSIYTPDKQNWRLTNITYAERATYRGAWRAQRGWVQDFTAAPPKSTPFADRELTSLEPPDYFKTEQPVAEMMTISQLKRYVEELSASGLNVVPQAVDLQRKMAFPFVTFVMTLLAVPFGVTTGRRGTLYGIGLGIVIALAYWILSSLFVAIGKGGLLAPALAAWAPNILVAGIALYLFLTART